jgi:hypothetical protein
MKKITAAILIALFSLTTVFTVYRVYQSQTDKTTLITKDGGIRYNPIDTEEDYQQVLNYRKTKTNYILIFHRPTCPDCQATYPYIEKHIKGETNIHTVNTDTALGRRILKEYDAKSIPWAVLRTYQNDTEIETSESIYQNETLKYMIDEKNGINP